MPAPSAARRRADRLPTSLKPIRDAAFGYDEARHLLLRAGFGGTPEQIQTLASWGPERAVDYLIDAEKVPTEAPRADAFGKDIMRPQTEEERRAYQEARRRQDETTLARLRRERQQRQRRDRQQMGQIQRWWLARLIETPRPLEEKMTLFWHGHFATSYRTIEDSYHMYTQNQLFRAGALGSYADLLYKIIRDPAMIEYLDNNDSRKNRPNENLAREIMELFSLGVGAYTEHDIKEGARALTGYTFRDDEFRFEERNHDDGVKQILGSSGRFNGEDFVGIILRQPACSLYMAAKLYDFFVLHLGATVDTDRSAADRVIREMAGVLRKTNYEIKPVLRRLMLSEHFYHPRVVGQRIKSPAELVVGAVRSLNTPVRDLGVLLRGADLMGQRLFYPPSVKGWDGGRSWINTSTMFVRQNIMNFLLTGKLPSGYDGSADTEPYDPEPLLSPLSEADPASARDAETVIEYLLRFTLGTAPADTRYAIEEFCAGHGNAVDRDLITGVLLLISAAPEYQLC